MTNDDKRSGSELLRDVERKLDNLERHVRNMDNNMKLVLSQFNQLMQALSQPEGMYPPGSVVGNGDVTIKPGDSGEVSIVAGGGKQEGDILITAPNQNAEVRPVKLGEGTEPGKTYKFEDLPKTNKFEQMQAHYGLIEEPERQKIKAQPESEESFDKYELVEESKKKGRARGQRVQQKDSNRVAVSQQILFPNGSPAYLAAVEISNAKGQVIKQVRTNTKGHWVAPLEPGDYTVHVVKHVPPDSDKQSFDIRYDVEIPASDKRMELPPPDMGEEDV